MTDTEVTLDVETLAERLEWARGAELISTLEELEAITARRPDVGGLALPALLKLLAEPTLIGAEGTQEAIEATAAAAANGAALLADPQNVVVLLDVMESEACETYTAVVILELLGALALREAARLRRALLAAPAGVARLVELLEDRRDELRNAAVALWERLTRPEPKRKRVQENGEASLDDADELRRCCAFNDGFSKMFAIMAAEAPEPNGVVRDAAALAANVLAGPDVALTCLSHAAPHGGLEPFLPLLRLPPIDLSTPDRKRGKSFDERIDETTTPRRRRSPPTTETELDSDRDDDDNSGDTLGASNRHHHQTPKQQQHEAHAKRRDASRCAAAALSALRRYVMVARGGEEEEEDTPPELAAVAKRQRLARQQELWAFGPLLEAVLVLALNESDLDPDSGAPFDDDEAWWATLTTARASPSRASLRCAALAVLRQTVEANEAHALALCELRVLDDHLDHHLLNRRRVDPKRALCARLVLKLATTGTDPVATAARGVAQAMWASVATASTLVMHAVAPPPSEDADADSLSALSALAAAFKGKRPETTRRALHLLRAVLARSPAVRELALRVPAAATPAKAYASSKTTTPGRSGDGDGDDDDDMPGLAFNDAVAALCDAHERNDETVLAEALALACAWVDDCGAAAHALLADPDAVATIAAAAKSARSKRARGLACLVFALCLEFLGDDAAMTNGSGWTRVAVHQLVQRRVGLGAFARALDGVKLEAAATSSKKKTIKKKKKRGHDDDDDDVFFDDDPPFAAWVVDSVTAAKKRLVGSLTTVDGDDQGGGDDAGGGSEAALSDLQTQLDAVTAERETLNEMLEAQAAEIARFSMISSQQQQPPPPPPPEGKKPQPETMASLGADGDNGGSPLGTPHHHGSPKSGALFVAPDEVLFELKALFGLGHEASAEEVVAAARRLEADGLKRDADDVARRNRESEAWAQRIEELERKAVVAAHEAEDAKAAFLSDDRSKVLAAELETVRAALEASERSLADRVAAAVREAEVEWAEVARDRAAADRAESRAALETAKASWADQIQLAKADAAAQAQARIGELEEALSIAAREAAVSDDVVDVVAALRAQVAEADQKAFRALEDRDAAEREADQAVDDLAAMQDRLFEAQERLAANKEKSGGGGGDDDDDGTPEGDDNIAALLRERVAELEEALLSARTTPNDEKGAGISSMPDLVARCARLEARLAAADEVHAVVESLKDDAMRYAEECESQLRAQTEELGEARADLARRRQESESESSGHHKSTKSDEARDDAGAAFEEQLRDVREGLARQVAEADRLRRVEETLRDELFAAKKEDGHDEGELREGELREGELREELACQGAEMDRLRRVEAALRDELATKNEVGGPDHDPEEVAPSPSSLEVVVAPSSSPPPTTLMYSHKVVHRLRATEAVLTAQLAMMQEELELARASETTLLRAAKTSVQRQQREFANEFVAAQRLAGVAAAQIAELSAQKQALQHELSVTHGLSSWRAPRMPIDTLVETQRRALVETDTIVESQRRSLVEASDVEARFEELKLRCDVLQRERDDAVVHRGGDNNTTPQQPATASSSAPTPSDVNVPSGSVVVNKKKKSAPDDHVGGDDQNDVELSLDSYGGLVKDLRRRLRVAEADRDKLEQVGQQAMDDIDEVVVRCDALTRERDALRAEVLGGGDRSDNTTAGDGDEPESDSSAVTPAGGSGPPQAAWRGPSLRSQHGGEPGGGKKRAAELEEEEEEEEHAEVVWAARTAALEKAADAQRLKVETLEQEIVELALTLDQQRTVLDAAASETLDAAEARCATLESDRAALFAANESVEATLALTESELAEAAAQRDGLQAEFDAARAAHRADLDAALEESRARHALEAEAIQTDLTEARADLDAQARTVAELESKVAAASPRETPPPSDDDDEDARRRDLLLLAEEERDRLAGRVEELETRNAAVEAAVETQRSTANDLLDKAAERYGILERELEQTMDDLDKELAEKAALEDRAAALDKELDGRAAAVDSLRTKLDAERAALEGRVAAIAAERDERAAVVESLKAEFVESLKAVMDGAAKNELAAVRRALELEDGRRQSREAAHAREVEEAAEAAEALRGRVEEYEEQVATLEAEREELALTLARQREMLTGSSEAAFEELRDRVASLEGEQVALAEARDALALEVEEKRAELIERSLKEETLLAEAADAASATEAARLAVEAERDALTEELEAATRELERRNAADFDAEARQIGAVRAERDALVAAAERKADKDAADAKRRKEQRTKVLADLAVERDAVARLTVEVEALARTCAETDEVVEVARAEVADWALRYASLEEDRAFVEDRCAELSSERTQLEAQRDELLARADDLVQDRDRLREELVASAQPLILRSGQKKKKKKDAGGTTDEEEEELSSSSISVGMVHDELNLSSSSNNNDTTKRSALVNKREAAAAATEDRCVALERENLALLKRTDELRGAVGEERDAGDAADARIAELEDEVAELRTCADDVGVLSERCGKLEAAKADLAGSVQLLEETVAAQRAALMEEKTEAVAQVEERCLQLRLERDDFRDHYAADHKEVAALRTEVEAVRSQNATLETRRAELEVQVGEHRQQTPRDDVLRRAERRADALAEERDALLADAAHKDRAREEDKKLRKQTREAALAALRAEFDLEKSQLEDKAAALEDRLLRQEQQAAEAAAPPRHRTMVDPQLALESEVELLTERLAEAEAEREDALEELEATKALWESQQPPDVADLERQIRDLEGRLRDSQQQEERDDDDDDDGASLATAQAELAEARAALTALSTARDVLEAELVGRAAAAEADRAAGEKRCAEEAERRAAVEVECTELEDKVAELELEAVANREQQQRQEGAVVASPRGGDDDDVAAAVFEARIAELESRCLEAEEETAALRAATRREVEALEARLEQQAQQDEQMFARVAALDAAKVALEEELLAEREEMAVALEEERLRCAADTEALDVARRTLLREKAEAEQAEGRLRSELEGRAAKWRAATEAQDNRIARLLLERRDDADDDGGADDAAPLSSSPTSVATREREKDEDEDDEEKEARAKKTARTKREIHPNADEDEERQLVLEAYQREAAEAAERCAEVERRVAAIDLEAVEATERAQAAEQRCATLKAELDSVRAATSHDWAREEAIEELRTLLDTTEKQLDFERAAREETEAAFEEHLEAAAAVDSQRGAADARDREATDGHRTAEASAADAHRAAADAAKAELRTEIEQLEVALDDAERRAEETAAHDEISEAMWEEQHLELEERTAEIVALREELREAERDKGALEHALGDARAAAAAAASLARDLDGAEAELADLRRRLHDADAFSSASVSSSAMKKAPPQALVDAENRARALDDELNQAKALARQLETTLDRGGGPTDDNDDDDHDFDGEQQAAALLGTTAASSDVSVRSVVHGGDDDDDRHTAEEWRALVDEHNDLLALLAQQELEKNKLRAFVAAVAGANALGDVRKAAQESCIERYGIYIAYDDDGATDAANAASSSEPRPLQLAYDDADDYNRD